VLAADAGLEACVPAGARRAGALARSGARQTAVAARTSFAPCAVEQDGGGYGVLVLEGVLIHQVTIEHRPAADLLGPGDVLPATPPAEGTCVRWRALTPLRLAALDSVWAARMSPYPEVSNALLARAVAQAIRAAHMMAVTGHPQLDVRLWLLLWALADRYGRVHPDGVHLGLPLTHDVLSQLGRARRPSVTNALSALAERGLLCRDGSGWILAGDADMGPQR
jgi:hypothetical protein